ncbi:MAG: hypothetical protein GX663_08960 [Clostridiales bacterium]|nr:hypothetical protein [Clostridiales bacterium]
MIYLYSGTPGSGKSLHQARDLYWWVRSGHIAICNFDFDSNSCQGHKKGAVYTLENEKLTPEFLIGASKIYFKNHKFKEGALRLYIDECQLLFNAREWNVKGRKEWLSFFTQHRKYGYDIYLVAQFDRMVDRQIRSLIEYEVVHRKVSNFGTFGKIMSLLSGGKLFVAVKVWYPLKEKVGSEFFKANKKYYELYDTYNKFNGD